MRVSCRTTTRPTTRADCPTRATGLGAGGSSGTMRLLDVADDEDAMDEDPMDEDKGTLRADGR